MQVDVKNLSEAVLLPHYRGVSMEVEPVATHGIGAYTVGHFFGQTYYTLTLERADIISDLHVGVTYSCAALSDDGRAVKTHWLYCMSVDPVPTFGLVKHWAGTTRFTPSFCDLASPFVELEELSNFTAIFPSHAPEGSISQAQIGLRGSLVSMRLQSPFSMGFLIENPTLPSAFCEGSQDIMIAARSVRTLQTICLDRLHCVKVVDTALFLKREEG